MTINVETIESLSAMKPKYNYGDSVGYAAPFIKSAGLPGDIANLKGTVLSSKLVSSRKIELVKVQWEDGHVSSAIAKNIAHVGSTRHINNDLP